LAGVTKAQFTPAVQTSFKKTVSASLKVCGASGSSQCSATDVVITSFSRRRSALSVEFYVKAGTATAASSGATSLNTFLKASDSTGFSAKLKTQVTADGNKSFADSVTGVTVTKAPKAKAVQVPTPAVGAASTTTTMSIASLACAAMAMW